MKIFAVGDIHGNLDGFLALLETLPIDLETDHLVLLGDLVDSGPQVRQLISWSIQFQQDHPDTFHVVRGNHEDLLLDFLQKKGYRSYDNGLWLEQGGTETLESYPAMTMFPEHLQWLTTLPVYWETDDYFFVHGGVRDSLLADHNFTDPATLLDLMWIRDTFIHSKFKWEKKIIFGHTPQTYAGLKAPFMLKNKIGINTQPRYKIGYLSAVELPEEKIWEGVKK